MSDERRELDGFCDECAHFKFWARDGSEPPAKYNPCAHGHKMLFKMPESYAEALAGDYGFCRLRCADRSLTAKPER